LAAAVGSSARHAAALLRSAVCCSRCTCQAVGRPAENELLPVGSLPKIFGKGGDQFKAINLKANLSLFVA